MAVLRPKGSDKPHTAWYPRGDARKLVVQESLLLTIYTKTANIIGVYMQRTRGKSYEVSAMERTSLKSLLNVSLYGEGEINPVSLQLYRYW